MKYKKIIGLLLTICLATTLNGVPVIAMESDSVIYSGSGESEINSELTDTVIADRGETSEEVGPQENLRENSWRYQNGELISNSVSAYSNERAAANAWSKVNGNFISSSGEIIPNAIAKGIDISYHNGTINWDKVKNSDVDFVIIRCG